jgi:Metal-dependent hydrolases of the beta-lactamase superfamily II
MRITTIIENYVSKSGLLAEHGLSFYIETENRKILFDTGQTSAFAENAKALGINLSEIDAVVLSHGHFDHTGGLTSFLEINSKATVYCKPEALWPKYHGPKKYVGMNVPEALLKSRLHFISGCFQLDEGVFAVADIPLHNKADKAFHNFQVLRNGSFEDDEFLDEVFLALVRNNKLSVISSCSHRGITNVVHQAKKLFPRSQMNMVLGGFHLKDENVKQYPEIVSYFNRIIPESIGTCHCSGVEMFTRLKNDLTSPVFYNFTGHLINL